MNKRDSKAKAKAGGNRTARRNNQGESSEYGQDQSSSSPEEPSGSDFSVTQGKVTTKGGNKSKMLIQIDLNNNKSQDTNKSERNKRRSSRIQTTKKSAGEEGNSESQTPSQSRQNDINDESQPSSKKRARNS